MFFATAGFLATPAIAVGPFTYDIDQDQSQLDLTANGEIFGGAVILEEQFTDAFPTSYSGTIEATFPSGPGPGGSISFPGGSSAAANLLQVPGIFPFLPPNNAQVTPGIGGTGGTAPANYGLTFSAPVNIELPAIPLPPDILGGIELNLGTISSIDINLALRDVVWDINSNLPPGGMPIDGSSQFDPIGNVGLTLSSGFADVNAALVLTQTGGDPLTNFVAAGAVSLALNSLVAAVPELGLTVSGPAFLSPDVFVGFGTRLDLTPGLLLPNGATDLATVTYDPLDGSSTLTLPVDLSLPDLGIPGIVDIDLGFSGQLVAAGVVTVPEPASGSLFLFVSVGFINAQVRRRRSA